MFIDYYKTLAVDRDSTTDQIKKAYRKLAFKYHPDVSKDINANTKFLAIQEAYEILVDISKKVQYNYLYDRHYQATPKTEFETLHEKKVYKDYSKWRQEATESAIKKSKEKFSIFKEGLVQSVGKGFDIAGNIYAIIIGLMIIGGTFVNLDTYLEGNKDAIWGVIICGVLSILIIAGLIVKSREI